MVKKFNWFKDNFSIIENLLARGYTHKEIYEKITEESNLNTTFRTYESYYYRLKKTFKSDSNEQNSIISKGSDNQNLGFVSQDLKSSIEEIKNEISNVSSNQDSGDTDYYEKPKSTLTRVNERTEKLRLCCTNKI